jgi:hypothetical protein
MVWDPPKATTPAGAPELDRVRMPVPSTVQLPEASIWTCPAVTPPAATVALPPEPPRR